MLRAFTITGTLPRLPREAQPIGQRLPTSPYQQRTSMQKYQNTILYSASDLCHFIECAHLSALDIRNLTDKLSKTEDSEDAKLIQRKGHEHEARYLQRLTERGLHVINIQMQVQEQLANVPEAERTQDTRNHLAHFLTEEAMKTGYDIIYQATFLHDVLIGHADFLKRVDKPSTLGDYSYEVMDTKLSRTAKSKFLTQLVFYSKLLSLVQGTDPGYMVVVLGDMTEKVYRYVDFKFTVERQLRRFLDFVKSAEEQKNTYPSPCAKCDQCHWRDLCKKQWDDDDHLCRVANITSGQMHKLNAAGVTTMAQLASLDVSTTSASRVAKIQPATLTNLVKQAELQKRGERAGRPIYELRPLKAEDKKGFYRLPAPSQYDLYFDMEGNPLVPGGLEYLFGLWLCDGGVYVFKAFWAHNRAEEKRAFEAFMDFVMQHVQRHPGAHVYHYAAYEETALKKLASLHGTREAQVDTLLREQKLVDLYKVVKESLWVSEPRYSIKNIEHFYRGQREGDVQNAGASIVMYEKWMEVGGDDLLQAIADYNKDDVESTYQLHVWLQSLLPADFAWRSASVATTSGTGKASSSRAEDSRSHANEVNPAEQALVPYRQRLLDPLPDDEAAWNDRQRLSALIFYLLDFHRRCMKPVWWALFNRDEQDPDVWLDEPDCIGGLQLTSHLYLEPKGRKRGRNVYQATFPEQDFKLSSDGQGWLFPGLRHINILAFDRDARTLTFEMLGDAIEYLPADIAIGKNENVNTDTLVSALYRFAGEWLQTPEGQRGRYAAVTDFLERRLPRINGLAYGAPLYRQGDDVAAVLRLVLDMDNTTMAIQGPPGAGKTYTGSHVIVGLVQAGKTVGVSSNSHKAIDNLLAGIEKVARAKGVRLWGMKKVNSRKAGTDFDGAMFTNSDDNEEVIVNLRAYDCPVAAGTAWLFADHRFSEPIDYLFVDEAGQVSVANLVAMGTNARNIVLLGDQMQLGQPIQGVHPGDSGLSALDYLLRGHATIPPQMGVFLGVSYRMNPDVCRFISNAVYDGRLQSAPGTVRQRLVLGAGAHTALVESGVRHVPINHAGCSQHSAEEVALVVALFDALLKQRVMDGAGVVRDMCIEDVLVVAPYNVQVNALTVALPEGARVGTVDKFQGQEAEVVIVSMTTSSEADLPRFMDFLYSKNRLNVAISRAKCVALFLANPKLMDIACSTPEQMALVNTVCWVGEVKAHTCLSIC